MITAATRVGPDSRKRTSSKRWSRTRRRCRPRAGDGRGVAHMKQTAAAGVQLLLVSGFRSVAHQADIIRRKLVAGQSIDAILAVNAAPGFSEHHTGRAIDVASPGTRPLTAEFEGSAAFAWLTTNAARFGFRMTDAATSSVSIRAGHWCNSTLTTGGKDDADHELDDPQQEIVHARRCFCSRPWAPRLLYSPRLHPAERFAMSIAQSGQTLGLALREVPTDAGRNGSRVAWGGALNRRDLMMAAGTMDVAGRKRTRAAVRRRRRSRAVGANVTRFKVGDRVAGIFFEDWIDGAPSAASLAPARGGNSGGMLSEIVVTDAEGLVSIPAHLSFEEAATLPCAGVTAWVGLFKRGGVEPGDFVLLKGPAAFPFRCNSRPRRPPSRSYDLERRQARAPASLRFGTGTPQQPECSAKCASDGRSGRGPCARVGCKTRCRWRFRHSVSSVTSRSLVLVGFRATSRSELDGLNATASCITWARGRFRIAEAFLSAQSTDRRQGFNLEAPCAFAPMDSGLLGRCHSYLTR